MAAEKTYCQFCGDEMSPGREFVFLVEAYQIDGFAETLEQSPHEYWPMGPPYRICEECHLSIKTNQQELEQEEQETMHGNALADRVWYYGLVYPVVGLLIILILVGLLRILS